MAIAGEESWAHVPQLQLAVCAEHLLLASRAQPLPCARNGRPLRAALRRLQQEAVDPSPLSGPATTLAVALLRRLDLLKAAGHGVLATAEAGAWLGSPLGSRLADLHREQLRVTAGDGHGFRPNAARQPSVRPVTSDAVAHEHERAAASWSISDDMVVLVPAPADLELLFDLEAFADCVVRGAHYHLTPATVALGLSAGLTPEGILGVLERGAGCPLPAAVAEQVSTWAERAAAVRLVSGVLLETFDPATLKLLYRRPSVRAHIARILSPRHALLRPGRGPALARLLARRGYHGPLAHETRQPVRPAVRTASAPWVAAAFVYEALSQCFDLPHLISKETLEASLEGLRPHEQRLVAEVTRRAMDALLPPDNTALDRDGEDSGSLPEPSLFARAILEWAVIHQQPVRIWYDTGGEGRPTPRVVEPLLLQRRGLFIYLVAFCHERGDERVFRLDRIHRVERPESI